MKKNILITGGTRGIGLGMAKEFLKLGHNVCITGRSEVSVARGLKCLRDISESSKLMGVPCQVADLDQVRCACDRAVEQLGSVDIWINNAGIANEMKPFDSIKYQEYNAVVDTNIIGVFNSCSVALTQMKKQGHGQIYNFEGHGSDGRLADGLSVYGTTKRAVTYFTQALIQEYKDSPVNIGFISPGIVITDMILKEESNMPAKQWEDLKRIYNILGDKVETTTPWLANAIIKDWHNHGSKLAWLTTGKIMSRFFKSLVLRKKRDLFTDI